MVRGSVEEGKLIGFYLVDGEVRAAVGLDRGGDPELDLDGEMAASARLVSTRARPAGGARRRRHRSVVAGLVGDPVNSSGLGRARSCRRHDTGRWMGHIET